MRPTPCLLSFWTFSSPFVFFMHFLPPHSLDLIPRSALFISHEGVRLPAIFSSFSSTLIAGLFFFSPNDDWPTPGSSLDQRAWASLFFFSGPICFPSLSSFYFSLPLLWLFDSIAGGPSYSSAEVRMGRPCLSFLVSPEVS